MLWSSGVQWNMATLLDRSVTRPVVAGLGMIISGPYEVHN